MPGLEVGLGLRVCLRVKTRVRASVWVMCRALFCTVVKVMDRVRARLL